MNRRQFEEIAANLREARLLGLFESDNAHRIVVANLASTFEKANPLFDGEKFEQACGVQTEKPVVWATAGYVRDGKMVTVIGDEQSEPEYVVDCD
jgi:hypothetical protein